MNKRKLKKGFTLIEIMVVLVILGLLGTIAVPKILGSVDEGRKTTTEASMQAIKAALQMYRMENGVYPTTEQGLDALVKKPDIDPIPNNWRRGGYMDNDKEIKDGWGNSFIYRSPGEEEDILYELISLGADNAEGGEDYNTDLKITDSNKAE